MCLFCCNCGACGKELPPELKAFHASMRTCQECGGEIPVGKDTCPECGWVRPVSASGPATRPNPGASAAERQKERLAAQLAKQALA